MADVILARSGPGGVVWREPGRVLPSLEEWSTRASNRHRRAIRRRQVLPGPPAQVAGAPRANHNDDGRALPCTGVGGLWFLAASW